jgi:hypothetical protein
MMNRGSNFGQNRRWNHQWSFFVLVMLALFSLWKTGPSISHYQHHRRPEFETTSAATDFHNPLNTSSSTQTSSASLQNTTTNHQARRIPTTPTSSRNKNRTSLCDFLDFAVVGFAKAGTTTMGHWLFKHPQVIAPRPEMRLLSQNKRAAARKTLKELVDQAPDRSGLPNWTTLVGYRNPHDIQFPSSLQVYQNDCQATKLIVLIRHPVLWFESFYNYRIQRKEFYSLSSRNPNLLKGGFCSEHPFDVCASTGAFHYYLSQLGKTSLFWNNNQNNSDERALLPDDAIYQQSKTPRQNFELVNPILLVETSQLDDYHNDEDNDSNSSTATNTTTSSSREALALSIQSYLGLTRPMPAAIPHAKRTTTATTTSDAIKKGSKKQQQPHLIDICHAQYQPIHDHLMEVSRNASEWILRYFLQHPSVQTAGHPGQLESILQTHWRIDPCLERRRQQEQEQVHEVSIGLDVQSRGPGRDPAVKRRPGN